jgi:hypothetical protein
MKKSILSILAIAALMFTACSDYETYGEKKEKERDAINKFIADSAFHIITEAQFHAQGDETSIDKREFVYLEKSGIYMQIMRKGCGKPITDGENLNILCRFVEIGISSGSVLENFYNYVFDYDKVYVSRSGSTYTASFVSGLMLEHYGASVPSGWIIPLNYINIGYQTDEEPIAKVRLIVPHSQGHSIASQYVYPYYYEITYQRGR